MSMGYPASQGYTGNSAAPTAPSGGQASFDYGSMMGAISSGFEAAGYFSMARGYKNQYRLLRRMSQQALNRGFEQGIDISREGSQFLGEMMALFGKTGTTLEGSPMLTLADTTRAIERNVLRTVEQARIESAALHYQARQAKRNETGARRAGGVKVGETVVKGIMMVGGGMG